jgi:uncharacterized membrane protein
VRAALVFIVLWISGMVLSVAYHLQPFSFVAYKALLSVVLFIMLQREWT